jgi:xanthine/CO dehydrogenase XdhC/CoxF family maturation factor
VTPDNGYGPLPYFSSCLEHESNGAVTTVIGGQALPEELGRHGFAGMDSNDLLATALGAVRAETPGIQSTACSGRILEVFAAPVLVPPALLLCGGGPDAIPVARLADCLGWRVTVIDHRPAFAVAAKFPARTRVILARAEELCEHFRPSKFDASVVMSHHLRADVEFLKQLARDPPGYIGLLGPKSRRSRLFDEAGGAAQAIRERIYGPVGLDIGANTPASIAVSIIAQIHAVLTGRCRGGLATGD